MVHRTSTFRGEIFVHRRHNTYTTIKTSLQPGYNTQPTHSFHTRDEASTFYLASTLTELQSTAGRRQMAHQSNRLEVPCHTICWNYVCWKLRASGSTVFAFTSYCEVFSHNTFSLLSTHSAHETINWYVVVQLIFLKILHRAAKHGWYVFEVMITDGIHTSFPSTVVPM